MPMVLMTLQTALTTIFNNMNSIYQDGDAYCADEMAKVIKTFILTGLVSTTDVGVAPAGSYAGAGTGVMTINSDVLKNDLLKTFEAGYSNDELANNMATDIDNACKESNIVKITSVGTVTTPVGATSPFSGTGEGTFTGVKATVATTLKACFSAMNNMATGGNEYFAAQLAATVFAYLQAGVINVTLNSPFISGTGVGKIS